MKQPEKRPMLATGVQLCYMSTGTDILMAKYTDKETLSIQVAELSRVDDTVFSQERSPPRTYTPVESGAVKIWPRLSSMKTGTVLCPALEAPQSHLHGQSGSGTVLQVRCSLQKWHPTCPGLGRTRSELNLVLEAHH